MNVTVYLRRQADGFQIVGLDRSWPGKNVVTPPPPPRADRRAYADLAPRQQELFQTYVNNYNATRGRVYTAEEVFERLTVSEQTTFYGVTHALLHTPLTDSGGAPMGLAPVVYELWQKYLKYDPANPAWPNRDRFVLSAGHASMLLYSTARSVNCTRRVPLKIARCSRSRDVPFAIEPSVPALHGTTAMPETG